MKKKALRRSDWISRQVLLRALLFSQNKGIITYTVVPPSGLNLTSSGIAGDKRGLQSESTKYKPHRSTRNVVETRSKQQAISRVSIA